MASTASWWASKARQFRSHLRARVTPEERSALGEWATLSEVALFDTMHVADQRHGLDVAAALRVDGVTDRDVLIAGLLHDAGKGQTGVWPRVAYSLGQAYGSWVWRTAGLLPGMGASLERLKTHADTSADLAAAAGCASRTVELIRWQDAPRDPEYGERLRIADDAN